MESLEKMELTNVKCISENHFISGQIEVDDIEDFKMAEQLLRIQNKL